MELTKKPFLLVCALGLAAVGLTYGWNPSWFVNKFQRWDVLFHRKWARRL